MVPYTTYISHTNILCEQVADTFNSLDPIVDVRFGNLCAVKWATLQRRRGRTAWQDSTTCTTRTRRTVCGVVNTNGVRTARVVVNIVLITEVAVRSLPVYSSIHVVLYFVSVILEYSVLCWLRSKTIVTNIWYLMSLKISSSIRWRFVTNPVLIS